MSLEKPSYRDNIERIKERYPTKEMLTISEVMKYTGLCRPTVLRMFSFKADKYISVATLAREMS